MQDALYVSTPNSIAIAIGEKKVYFFVLAIDCYKNAIEFLRIASKLNDSFEFSIKNDFLPNWAFATAMAWAQS